MTRCRVSHCEADVNQDGGGVTVFGSDSVFDCGVVTHCSRYQWNGESLANGGGVAVANGGRLLNTLVMHCTANNAGGVNLASGAVMRNCTVVNNSCSTTGKGGGGIFAAAGCLVENCIAWGNVDGDEPDPAAARHNVIGAAGDISHCCFPVSVGTACVTAAPGFRNAAADDYRIGASSPCARAGVYRNWMAGTTDFFGNPRATPGGRVSIGFCQVQDFGLKLIVR